MGYFSVFASSFSSVVPIFNLETCDIYEEGDDFFGSCRLKYWFYEAIYFGFMIYLVLKGFSE